MIENISSDRPFGQVLAAIAIFRASIGAFILVASYWKPAYYGWASVILFVIAQLSDQLDGLIARRFSIPTLAGYLQDALADKLLTIGCLLTISRTYPFVDLALLFIVCRELVVLAMRLLQGGGGKFVQRARVVSLWYYALIRSSILCFLLSTLDDVTHLHRPLVQAAYVLLLASLAIGGYSIVTLRHPARLGSE